MRTLFPLLLLLAAVSAQAQPAPTGPLADPLAGLSAEQASRFETFTHELRCLVCQNQNIAESQAPLAQDLRQKVSEQLRQGKTDAEIVGWLTERYGDYVLYRPPFRASTFLLWAGPFLLVLVALVLVLRFVRKSPPPAAASPVDEAALQRLLAEHRSDPSSLNK